MNETELEMARRHVTEGREHIARQRALIAKLVTRGQDRVVRQARRLLATQLETQRLAEEHLAQLEHKDD
jgi:hypothetical protein